jgi:iron complex transport system permease protein
MGRDEIGEDTRVNPSTTTAILDARKAGTRKTRLAATVLAIAAACLCAAMLMAGTAFYGPAAILRVLAGEQVPGASFAVGTLRLPRMVAGLFAGFAFGMAGCVFQTLLRNPLASPDVIGVSTGASAAAVFCILVLRAAPGTVLTAAIAAGLGTTALIYALSAHKRFSPMKLIVIGIGVQAALGAVVSYILLRAPQYDVPAALRWLNGSLNGIRMKDATPLALAVLVCAPAIAVAGRGLEILELGDEAAASLGVRVQAVRITLMACSVALISFATATTGPLAFVSFLAGPISRGIAGSGKPSLLTAGLTGATLTLAADLVGQFAFGTRYPAGVITGMLGAPYLLFSLIHLGKKGEL